MNFRRATVFQVQVPVLAPGTMHLLAWHVTMCSTALQSASSLLQSANVDQATWDETQSRVRRFGGDGSRAARAAKMLLTKAKQNPGVQQLCAQKFCKIKSKHRFFNSTLVNVQSLPVHPAPRQDQLKHAHEWQEQHCELLYCELRWIQRTTSTRKIPRSVWSFKTALQLALCCLV